MLLRVGLVYWRRVGAELLVILCSNDHVLAAVFPWVEYAGDCRIGGPGCVNSWDGQVSNNATD